MVSGLPVSNPTYDVRWWLMMTIKRSVTTTSWDIAECPTAFSVFRSFFLSLALFFLTGFMSLLCSMIFFIVFVFNEKRWNARADGLFAQQHTYVMRPKWFPSFFRTLLSWFRIYLSICCSTACDRWVCLFVVCFFLSVTSLIQLKFSLHCWWNFAPSFGTRKLRSSSLWDQNPTIHPLICPIFTQ